MRYALDTNIISFYLKGNDIVADNIRRALLDGSEIVITHVAYYEIRRGLLAVGAVRRLHAFESLCALLEVGEFSSRVLDTAAVIYAQQRKLGRNMEDADIFIAAFCQCNDYTLVTNNIRHFAHIANLSVCDWSKPTT